MKTLVFVHTHWTEWMAHAMALAGMEIVPISVPTRTIGQDPSQRYRLARQLADTIRDEHPGLIIDVNGVGTLPLDPAGCDWTPDTFDGTWCNWWWDTPRTCAQPLRDPTHLALWLARLRSSCMRHFMWDATLAREYERWFQAPVHPLPTATHPGFFRPEVAAQCPTPFPEVDLCFLGSYYSDPDPNIGLPAPELDTLSSLRLRHSDLTVFDLADLPGNPIPAFRSALYESAASSAGPFSLPILEWMNAIDHRVGRLRRTIPLDTLHSHIPSTRFVGSAWPDRFSASPTSLYHPTVLAACYRASRIVLDLSAAQSFSGTTMRCYEAMAVGATLLCHRGPDFDPDGRLEGTAYLAYGSPAELVNTVRRHAPDTRKLKTIGANARQFILDAHTWVHRAENLLQQIARRKAA